MLRKHKETKGVTFNSRTSPPKSLGTNLPEFLASFARGRVLSQARYPFVLKENPLRIAVGALDKVAMVGNSEILGVPLENENPVEIRLADSVLALRLPATLRGSDFYTESPFTVFSQSEVVSPEVFDLFCEELERFMGPRLPSSGVDGKRKFELEPSSLTGLKDFPLVQDFCGALFSPEFQDWFRKTHAAYYYPEGHRLIFAGTAQASKWLTRFVRIFRGLLGLKPFSVLHLSVEFSAIDRGGRIAQHTDSFYKRLALVFYPVNSSSLTEEMRAEWGTQFWGNPDETDFRSWESNPTGEEADTFKRGLVPQVQVPYEANTINGFVKSGNSWHSVAENRFDKPRKAVVINVVETTADEADIPEIERLQGARSA